MKAKRIVYRDLEGNLFSPRVVYAKIISEDDTFLSFLTGKGKSYRIAKTQILSVEDTDRDFILQEAV